eukprot:EC690698.1.p2 GENE.EC690698.1~~EC690698.1.p2  ORF type:complete len:60 (-),score=10.09 EC690698.1:207-386(-)
MKLKKGGRGGGSKQGSHTMYHQGRRGKEKTGRRQGNGPFNILTAEGHRGESNKSVWTTF